VKSTLRQALESQLGQAIKSLRPLSGGDICQGYALTLDDGQNFFAKTRPGAPAGMFKAEASGLQWLRQARALRIPEVIAVDEQFLVLEYLASGVKVANFDEVLGQRLAALHRAPVTHLWA
jgi:fructosamine-3-kinase